MDKKPLIHLSFDVEEIRDRNNKVHCGTDPSKKGCLKLLKLLKKLDIKSTFFVTGYFAEREKRVVKKIIRDGHEIGNHGLLHENLTKLSKKEAEEKIRKSTVILEKIFGERIFGFRAPYYAINNDIIKILENLGYKYDSSLHKSITQIPNFLEFSRIKNDKIVEIPISTLPVIPLPISSHWSRNFGMWITKIGTSINLKLNQDIVLFFHAWDFAEISDKNIPYYMRKNTGEVFLNRLKKFLIRFEDFEFSKLRDYGGLK